MKDFLNIIFDYWFVIVAIAAVAGVALCGVKGLIDLRPEKQIDKVKEWLLYAVTKAEKELGGGTGQIKLRFVYDMFVERFESVAEVVTFDVFSGMVDDALEKMKGMISSNKAVQEFVEGTTDAKEGTA